MDSPSPVDALEDEVYHLKNRIKRMKRRADKDRSRNRRHRHHSSDNSGSDTEDDGRQKVSFIYNEGNKPFLTLAERYRAVDIKYFKQIFYGTFNPRNLPELARDHIDFIEVKDKKKDEDF